jgi:hypothetical protein
MEPVDNSNLLVPAHDPAVASEPDQPAPTPGHLQYDPLDLSELRPPFVWVTADDWSATLPLCSLSLTLTLSLYLSLSLSLPPSLPPSLRASLPPSFSGSRSVYLNR